MRRPAGSQIQQTPRRRRRDEPFLCHLRELIPRHLAGRQSVDDVQHDRATGVGITAVKDVVCQVEPLGSVLTARDSEEHQTRKAWYTARPGRSSDDAPARPSASIARIAARSSTSSISPGSGPPLMGAFNQREVAHTHDPGIPPTSRDSRNLRRFLLLLRG